MVDSVASILRRAGASSSGTTTRIARSGTPRSLSELYAGIKPPYPPPNPPTTTPKLSTLSFPEREARPPSDKPPLPPTSVQRDSGGGFQPFKEISNAVTGSLAGVWQAGKLVAGTTYGAAKLATDALTGEYWGKYDQWGDLGLEDDDVWNTYFTDATQIARATPQIVGGYRDSLAGVVQRMDPWRSLDTVGLDSVQEAIDEAAARDYHRRSQEMREGRLLDSFITDFGFMAAGAGLGASVARGVASGTRLANLATEAGRAGQMTRLSRVADRATRAASILDNMSYRADWSDPAIAAGRLVKKTTRRLLDRPSSRLAEALGRAQLNERARAVANQHGMLPLLEEQRAGRSIANMIHERVTQSSLNAERTRKTTDILGRIDPDGKLTAPQRRVITLLTSGAYQPIFRAIDNTRRSHPELAAGLLHEWNESLREYDESMVLTMDDVDAAIGYMDKRLDAPQMRTMQQAIFTLREQAQQRTQMLLDANRLTEGQTQQPRPVYDEDGLEIIDVEDGMLVDRVQRIADQLDVEAKKQSEVVSGLEGDEARLSQQFASQSLHVQAARPPGQHGADYVSARDRAVELARNQRALSEEVRQYEVKISALQSEWQDLRSKIQRQEDTGQQVRPHTARRERDLKHQIIEMEAILDDLRTAKATMGSPDEPPPRVIEMGDDDAILTVVTEYADVFRDSAQFELDLMRDVGGTPSRTAVESVARAAGAEGQRYRGKHDIERYVEMGVLSETGVNVHDFTARLRAGFEEWRPLSDAELMEQYFRVADVVIDLADNDIADIPAVINPIAYFLEMSPDRIRDSLNDNFSERLGDEALDVLDQVRTMTRQDYQSDRAIPGIDIENQLRDVINEVPTIVGSMIQTFDELMAERGVNGAGAQLADIIDKMDSETLIGWLAHGRIPSEVSELMTSGRLLGDTQIAAMDRAVQYMRTARRGIVEARRQDILQGREHLEQWADQKAVEQVNAFNEDLAIANYRTGSRVDPPEITVDDLPSMRQLHRDATEMRMHGITDADDIVSALSERYGLDEVVVREGLNGSRAQFETEYRAQVEARVSDAIDVIARDGSHAAMQVILNGDGQILRNTLYLADPKLLEDLKPLVSDWDELARWIGDQLATMTGTAPLERPPQGPPIVDQLGNADLVRRRAELGSEMRDVMPSAFKLADQAKMRVASLSDAARQAEVERVEAAGDTPPGYWERGENGELSPGEQAAAEMGATRAQLAEVRSNLRWERKKLDRIQYRARNLESELSRSQQHELRRVHRNAIEKVRRVTYQLSKRPLGGIELVEPVRSGDRPHYKITGTIRDVADKLGITREMYRILDARPGPMKTPERDPTQMGAMVMGQRPPSLDILYEAIDNTDSWDLLQGEIRDELTLALIADDIQRSLDKRVPADAELLALDLIEEEVMYRIDQAVRMHEAGQRSGRITLNELSPKIGNDFVRELQAAFDEGRMKRAHRLKVINEQSVAVMPAPYARVARLTRRQLGQSLNMATELFAESRRLVDQATAMSDGPARQRIMAEAGAKRAEAMFLARGAEELPTNLLMMVRQGINPTHLIGGPGITMTGPRQQMSRNATLADAPTATELQMRTGFIEPDLDNYTRREIAVMMDFMRREVVKAVANDPELSLSMEELLREDIEAWRQRNNTQQWPSAREMRDWARDKGFEIVGRRPTRQGETSDIVDIEEEWQVYLTEDIPETFSMETGGPRVIPRALAKAIRDQLDYRPSQLARNWDALQGIWKVPILALRTLWWTNNIIGNALMAMAGTGTTWIPLPKMAREMQRTLMINKKKMENLVGRDLSIREFRAALRELEGELPAMDHRLAHHGLTSMEWAGQSALAEPDFMLGRALRLMMDPEYVRQRREATLAGTGDRKLGPVRAKVLSRLSRTAAFGYRMNELGDNLFRSTMANIELNKRLPDGITPEDVHLGRVPLNADVERAIRESTEAALGALGDFSRLMPFERRYIKRLVPFYPWLRHQVRISMLMPLMAPQRAAFLYMLHTVMTDDEDQGKNWQEAFGTSIDTPFGRLRMGGANPFVGPSQNVIFSGEGARSVSPLLALGVETFVPIDISQMAPYRRPQDQTYPDLYGGEESQSIAGRALEDPFGALGELAFNVSGLTPQTATLRDAALSRLPGTGFQGQGSRSFLSSVADSGDVTPYPDREGGAFAKWMRGFGMPWPENQPEYEERVRLQDMARRRQGG